MSAKMRIGVLGSASSWYTKDLARVAATTGDTIVPVSFSQLKASVGADGESFSSGDAGLGDLDGIIVRSMPPGSLEQVVFRMNALARLECCGQVILNPPRSLEVAIDKYLALARLRDAGFTVPETVCCQTADQAMVAFETLGGDVVLKPLFGGEGRGLVRVTEPGHMHRAAMMLTRGDSVVYVQQFIPHQGLDHRLVVIGDEVFGMIRRNENDWRTNVSLGAETEPLAITTEMETQAHAAASAVGAPFCAVDLLPGIDGELYALEVNAVPGWRALARTLDLDIAARVLELMRQKK